ncbi:MAG: hypothetical protein IKR37_01920, partial [Paludibacteraceae bacterium]|nr:hypothetical protein [Paludibacteraceae bacterium]
MEIIMQPGASLIGILDRSAGYYIRQRGNRFFAVRMKDFFSLLACGQVTRDGHWQTITQFAQLAQIGNIVK